MSLRSLSRRAFAGLLGTFGAPLIMLLALPGGARRPRRIDAVAPVVPSSLNRELAAGAPVFKICRDQTYALCAVASCFVFDQVAYCKCDVEQGDSISLPFEFDGQDVCSVNAEGPANGFMVSTFSLPASVVEGGDQALYTCSAGTADGSYAQCDGGLCFTSTEASPSFPGFDEPLAEGQIICSCPITTAAPGETAFGYQIAGPFPCEDSFFENCSSASDQPENRVHHPGRRADRRPAASDAAARRRGAAAQPVPVAGRQRNLARPASTVSRIDPKACAPPPASRAPGSAQSASSSMVTPGSGLS